MPRKRRVDNPETLEDESLLDVPETDGDVDGSDAMPVQGFHIPAQIKPAPKETSTLTTDEHEGYSLALRGLESLRLTTFCTNEARVLRSFIDKLESLFGKP